MNITIAAIISIIIGAIIGFLIFIKKDKKYNNNWKYVTSALRGLSVAIITFLLLAMNLQYVSNEKKKPVVVWLQDNSESFKNGLQDKLSDYVTEQEKILERLNSEYQIETYQFGENIVKDNQSDFSQKITHIDFALQNIINRYQNENLGAIILSSDGIYNRGSDPNYSLMNKNNTHIYTVAIGDSSSPKDISIQRVYANKVVTVGNEFEIAFDVRFSQYMNSQHNINLLQNGQVIRSKSQNVSEQQHIASESFVINANNPGIQHFQIQVPVADGEATEVNNTFDFFIEFISNEVKILVVNNGAHPDIGYINQALKLSKGFKFDIAPPQTLPENFNQYDILILHQPQLNPVHWKKIAESKLPTWHILGNNTHPLQIELIKNIFNIQNSQSIIPIQNLSISSQFHFFRLPLSAQDVIKKMPPLESRVVSMKVNMPSEVFIKNNQTDVWAFSSMHPVAVTIGEGIWKWGIYEMRDFKSQVITHELIQQTLHTLKKPQLDKTLSVFLNKKLLTDQEHIAFSAEVRNSNGQLVNSSDVQFTIESENGYNKNYVFDRLGNSYHKLVPPLEAGEYTFIAETILDGKKFTDRGQFVIENIPLEFMNTQADYAMMYNLAKNNNGNMYTIDNMNQLVDDIETNDKITTIIHSETVNNPWVHYKWLFFLVMGLLTLEWFIRKYNAFQ